MHSVLVGNRDVVHRLCYDGRSWRNLESGGSRPYNARVDLSTGGIQIVWTAAANSAHRTTRIDKAKCMGLLVVLGSALRYRWPAPDVNDDSALMLGAYEWDGTQSDGADTFDTAGCVDATATAGMTAARTG
jgi:hypothetical protein